MEKKKTKKKWREIRSAVTMMCVMAAMLSSATFAWFTLTNSPTVTGMQMTAATTGGLLVSNEENGSYGESYDFADSIYHKLSPVTATAAATFAKPVYTGNVVNSTEALTLDYNTDNGYVMKYTCWLKTTPGTGTVKVGLMGGTGTTGTYVVRDQAQGATQEAAAAIRVGFNAAGAWKIYEPSSHATFTGTMATNGVVGPTSDIKQIADGTFEVAADTYSSTSKEMFEVGETPVQVDIYFWLEGTDNQCVNEIQADELRAQIQFTVVQ